MTWSVSALCQAIAQALDARFNPVTVKGEITSFSRAASGHCYFSLKDAQGKIRCAMFRRAASLLAFSPKDGDLVEVRGRVAVYEPRGDLQLVAESMSPAGQGAWYEEFLRLKAALEAQGLFDTTRKRQPPTLPRCIGLVTSASGAALHDVATALRRRAPHVPVVLAPSAVQGAGAPQELVGALRTLYRASGAMGIDTILLVRGGGSLQDLWAFNDAQLARVITECPVPLICGVGHETDVTIADLCADVRAPTPTAAAELAACPRAELAAEVVSAAEALVSAVDSRLDVLAQRLDLAVTRLGRPSMRVAQQGAGLSLLGQRLRHACQRRTTDARRELQVLPARLQSDVGQLVREHRSALDAADMRLRLLDPRRVLERGYAWLARADGQPLMRAAEVLPGDHLSATLADGEVDLVAGATRLR